MITKGNTVTVRKSMPSRRRSMASKGKTVTGRKSIHSQRRALRNLRGRVLAGFRSLGHGVDAETARQQMHAFYRSSGNEWTRCLA